MIEIGQKAFEALHKSAAERGVEVCQKCPNEREKKIVKTLYLGPNGESEIIYREIEGTPVV